MDTCRAMDADSSCRSGNGDMETLEGLEVAAGLSDDEEEWDLQAAIQEIQQSHSISNQLRAGMFESDCATQTEVTEVLQIKEMTSVIHTVTQDLDIMKKDVVLQKNLLQAEYEKRIEAQALELHNHMNDAVRDLEEVHRKKISTLRKSFQKQLIDALAVIRSSYGNHYNRTSGFQKSHDTCKADAAKIQVLQRKIDEKDHLIQSLEAQLLVLQEDEQPKQIVYQAEDDPEKEKLLEENQELRQEMEALRERAGQLEAALKEKIKHIHSLDLDVGAMKTRIEEDQRTIEKLSFAREQLQIELENEKAAASSKLQQQKQDMESVIRLKLEDKEKQQAQLQREQEEKLMGEFQRQKQQLILEAEQLRQMKERKKSPRVDIQSMNADKEKLLAQIKQLLSVKEEDAKTIERLRKELERLNRMWEKKYEILKQSFHAIKDEMFVRQVLHRQAMNLHRVSVSYMTDDNVGAIPTELSLRNSSYLASLPLPQIGVKLPAAAAPLPDIPAHCKEASEPDRYTEDELQVVSDTEEDLGGVPPLPLPPPVLHSERMTENEGITL